jgi:hypothetical protein
MKTSYFTAVLILSCLLGVDIKAHAQDAGGVVVKVPFEFIAGGKMLPAGTYSVGRLSPDIHPALMIDNKDTGAFALVLPSTPVGESTGHTALSFERVGDQVFLNKVETPAGAYIILTPRAIAKVAKSNGRGTTLSSGTN